MIPTRPLGQTGERISCLGFGTASAGTRLGLKQAARLYEEALNLGVTYFDTAPDFTGYGQAQKQLGQVLRKRRKEVFLVTKCFEPDGERALKLLKQNLRELQTDHADLVFVHNLGADQMDPRTVFGRRGCYAALRKARADGLTRFVGLSGHNRPHRFVRALRRFPVDVLLNAVNFADRHTYNFEQQVWPLARDQGIGLIAMKVFGGQDESSPHPLSHRKMPEPYLDWALRYALGQPSVAAAAVGMATREELAQNVRRARNWKPLSAAETRQALRLGQDLARRWGDHLGAVR